MSNLVYESLLPGSNHGDHEHGIQGCLTGRYEGYPTWDDIGWTTAEYCPPVEPTPQTPEVPLPAAGWLLVSALVGLVMFKRAGLVARRG